MRISNQMDGMYFLLLFIPFVVSIWMGDYLRKMIVSHLLLARSWSQPLSTIVGVSVQSLIMITGVLIGYFLIRLI
jgi:hypothetical protein